MAMLKNSTGRIARWFSHIFQAMPNVSTSSWPIEFKIFVITPHPTSGAT